MGGGAYDPAKKFWARFMPKCTTWCAKGITEMPTLPRRTTAVAAKVKKPTKLSIAPIV